MEHVAELDPLKIAAQRPDRDHIFRGLSIHHRIVKLCDILQLQKATPMDDEYWERLTERVNQLRSVLDGMQASIDNRDVFALQERLCELEGGVHGTHYVASVPYTKNMTVWTEAKLTTYCSDDVDLAATTSKYDDLGVEYDITHDEDSGYYVLRSRKDQRDAQGRHWREGEVLPSAFHREVDFHPQFR